MSSSMVRSETSKVPPPRSKIRTFFSPTFVAFLSTPYAMAVAVGTVTTTFLTVFPRSRGAHSESRTGRKKYRSQRCSCCPWGSCFVNGGMQMLLVASIDFGKGVEATLDLTNFVLKNKFSTYYKVVIPSRTSYFAKKLNWTNNFFKSWSYRKLGADLEKQGRLSHPNTMMPLAYVLRIDCATKISPPENSLAFLVGMSCPPNTHKPSFHVNATFLGKNTVRGGSRTHKDSGNDGMATNLDEYVTEEEFLVWVQNAMASGIFDSADGVWDNGVTRPGNHAKSNRKKKKDICHHS
eukprot:Gb_06414 [translate_table: standard]